MELCRNSEYTKNSSSSFSSDSTVNNDVLCNSVSKDSEKVLESDMKCSDQKLELDLNGHLGTKCSVRDAEENGEVILNADDFVQWPKKDFEELLKRIVSVVPNNDRLAYNTQVEKINWDLVSFKDYTSETCKKAWMVLQKKIRKFRLFTEVLNDAKELLHNSWPNFLYPKNRHPDMPKRPMTAYMIYYMKKKDKILLENPGIELGEVAKKIAFMYKNLPDYRKNKYSSLASEELSKYKKKLGDFYKNHPEISCAKTTIEPAPKKPRSPFALYFEQHFVKYKPKDDEKAAFKEKYKRRWKNLCEEKKLKWIDYALEKEAEYKEELQKYVLRNSAYVPTVCKPILTKEEKFLKDKLTGKPKKPPTSAYGLFSQILMQSDEIKKVDVRHRIKTVAEHWKICSVEEKNQYKERADDLRLQYNYNYSAYLESLPEDKRTIELQNNIKKRKKNNDGKNTVATSINSAKITKADIHSHKKKKVETITGFENNETIENNILATTSASIHKTKKSFKGIKAKIENNIENVTIHCRSNEYEMDTENERNFKKNLDTEPPAPPRSAMALYGCRYKGEDSIESAWKKLNQKNKLLLEQELKQIKEQYIIDYELFLTRFDEKQLHRFAKLKKNKTKKNLD